MDAAVFRLRELCITFADLPDEIIAYRVSGQVTINQRFQSYIDFQGHIETLIREETTSYKDDCIIEIKHGTVNKRFIKSI